MACIEYCIDNADAAARRRLAGREDARGKPCLQRCGRCARGPILVVGGELRTGASHADLLGEP
ncbi:MAG: hypothetical protein ABEI39_05385 [Halobacteriales archaeon]